MKDKFFKFWFKYLSVMFLNALINFRKTPRTASHSEAQKSLNGGEEIEEELDLSQEADDLLKSEDSEVRPLYYCLVPD